MKIYPPGERPEPYRIHAKHHWLNAAYGLLVFLLGVVCDVGIGEVRYRWPHKVRWVSGYDDHYRLGWVNDSNIFTPMVDGKQKAEFGLSDDEDDTDGYCRKYPPEITHSGGGFLGFLSFTADVCGSWPVTEEDDWCGDTSRTSRGLR